MLTKPFVLPNTKKPRPLVVAATGNFYETKCNSLTKKQSTTTLGRSVLPQTEVCMYVPCRRRYNIAPPHKISHVRHREWRNQSCTGSRQSFKTCNGADELAVRTLALLREFVCLFVCAYDSRYACGGTATAETTFLGRDPEYTRVTAEETRCRIAY